MRRDREASGKGKFANAFNRARVHFVTSSDIKFRENKKRQETVAVAKLKPAEAQ
jgi:hypothetical protein